jgi:hypothetical protein
MIADLDRVFNREWTLMHANGLMRGCAAIRGKHFEAFESLMSTDGMGRFV